jgi:hypothetical protein
MERVLSHGLWREVSKIARSATKVHAAIAYVTQASLLPLKRGDVLITDASESAIRSGQTSVAALRALANKGVEIWTLPALHAKVLVADQTVVVGSANASESSAHHLIEAAVLTTSDSALATAHSFIVQAMEAAKKVSDRNLARLAAIPVVRPKLRRAPLGRESASIRLGGQSAWFVGVHELRDDAFPDENPAVDEFEKAIQQDLGIESPDWVRFVGKSRFRSAARGGDLLIVATAKRRGGKPHAVSPPTAILRRQEGKRWTRFYYEPKLVRPMESINWATFLRIAKKSGLPELMPGSARGLSQQQMENLKASWPRRGRG